MDCIFCKIVERKIPSTVLYETDDVMAFREISPQAPFHVLVIPKRHIESVAAAKESDSAVLGKLLFAIGEIARAHGVDKDGFRIVSNTGQSAGQSIRHLHFHLMAGRDFSWPAG